MSEAFEVWRRPGATLYRGDCLDVLPTFAEGSADAVVTDPPYLLDFMGRDFDRQHRGLGGDNEGQKMQGWHRRWAVVVLRVLKPGGYLLAFGGTRTWHRLACALEDAGFELRDTLVWLHGQGFPKGKACLKPGWEPVLLCRKPAPRMTPLNIDEARIPASDGQTIAAGVARRAASIRSGGCKEHEGWDRPWKRDVDECARRKVTAAEQTNTLGRYPPNVCLSHSDGCRLVGTKRVKAATNSGGPGCTKRNGTMKDGWSGAVPAFDYADADGLETVEAWTCVEEFSGYVPAFVHKNVVCTLADEPEFLLGRLQVLLQALSGHSMTDSTLLRSACAFYCNEGTSPDETLADDVAHALGATAFLGSLPGYPSSRGSCGELLRPILAACRSGLPSLCDALAGTCSALLSRGRSPQRRSPGHPSTSGDSPPPGSQPDRRQSRESGVPQPAAPSGGKTARNGGTAPPESTPSGQGDSRSASSNGEVGRRGTWPDNADNAAAARLLWALCADLAWRFILPAQIIRRSDMHVNLAPCPVRLLDEQAGPQKSGGSPSRRLRPKKVNVYGDFGDACPPGIGASAGNVSRFFYVAKASRKDRGEGNDHPTCKSTALMSWLLSLVTKPGDVVLDPFAGSGSTGVACLRAGREFVGVERDAHYWAIARDRLAGVDGPLFAHAAGEVSP